MSLTFLKLFQLHLLNAFVFFLLSSRCSILVQSNFRAMKGRRRSAAKRRMKFDNQLAMTWRKQQGYVMRLFKLNQRKTQRLGYRFMSPLGLLPISYNFSTTKHYGLRHEIQLVRKIFCLFFFIFLYFFRLNVKINIFFFYFLYMYRTTSCLK